MAAANFSFSSFFNQAPVIIHGGSVYHIKDRHDPSDEHYLTSGALQLGISKAEDLTSLESRTLFLMRDDIESFKQQYIAESLEYVATFGKNKGGHLQQTKFATMEVLPLLLDSMKQYFESTGKHVPSTLSGQELIRQKIKEVAGDITDDKDENTDTVIASLREKITNDLGELFDKKSLLEYHLGRLPLYIASGRVYQLQEQPSDYPFTITIEGTTYMLGGLTKDIDNQNHSLQKLFEHRFMRQALDASEEQIREEAQKLPSTKALDILAQQDSLDINGVGWLNRGGHTYVYVTIPQFAMRNPNRPDVYHPFPNTRIAIPFSMEGTRIYPKDAYVIDAMVHPFLSDWGSGFEHVCNLGEQGGERSAFGITRRLADAVNVFTNGLTKESIDRHGGGGDNSLFFGHKLKSVWEKTGELSREEALAQNYLITNDWHIAAELEKQKNG